MNEHTRPPAGSSVSAQNIGALHTGSGDQRVGTGMVVNTGPAAAVGAPTDGSPVTEPARADVGVLTVLRQETRAVVDVLTRAPDYRTHPLPDGAQVHEASFASLGGLVRVVGTQALEQGQRSAAEALRRLQRHYQPRLMLLVGIAGGINQRLAIGDVVLSTEVIYYDARRESAQGTHRRGQSHQVAAMLRHRLNEFLRLCDAQLVDPGTGERFQVLQGPIGSGEAVITDLESPISAWLREFHEKVLAVETEAASLAQSFYEQVEQEGQAGWLTIRGISDLANQAKVDAGDRYHDLASRRAAVVLERLLPFLSLPRRSDLT